MNRRLRAALATPDFSQRLAALAEGANASALISLSIDLGRCDHNWLDRLPHGIDYWYWAQPARRDFRLGLGSALQVVSAGSTRFAALANAFAGCTRHWRYERLPGAFIGFAFDELAQEELPNTLLAVPAITLCTVDGRCQASFTTVAGAASTAIGQWLDLLAEPRALPPAPCAPAPGVPLAERAWLARVDAALRDIITGRLDKVVLARSVKMRAASPIGAAPVLADLLESQPTGTIFAHARGQRVFLGASPERLASLRAGRAEADALAGTAWPHSPADHRSGRIDDDKNRREQQLVVEAVQAALAPLCSRLDVLRPPEVMRLNRLAHLHSRVAGEPLPGVTLFDLVRCLHPTPAVGGTPAAAAIDWLRSHGERRGAWYSGGIGHIAADGEGEIAVALRCALLDGHEAELYAGAGIVAGSQALQELAETEAKLTTMREALCRHRADTLEKTGTR